MTPEAEILSDLLEQAERSTAGLRAAAGLIDTFPADEVAFAAMSPMQGIATTAMLKQVEQLEGALNGAFRATLEHPFDLRSRFVRTRQAYAMIDPLNDALMRLREFIDARGWMNQ